MDLDVVLENIVYDKFMYDNKEFVVLNSLEFTKENLKNTITFNQGDFVEQIDKLPASNNLVMCRNMWYYLGENRLFEIIDKLSKKLDNTSLLVIGDFDRKYIINILKWSDFEEISLNVFRKKKQL